MSMKAKEAYELLVEGNHRFVRGLRSVETQSTPAKLKELAEKGQKPFAIVLACSDSRVPAEIVFDRGLGDLFVIRIAGNVVSPSIVASIEFAALQFGSPICVVMGHTGCGAIKATIARETEHQTAPTENLERLVGRVRPAYEKVIGDAPQLAKDPYALEAAVTNRNVLHSVSRIFELSSLLTDRVKEGKLSIRSALYDLHTGAVTFDLEGGKHEKRRLIA